MTTFCDVLDWDTSQEFYKDIDITTCGLHIDTFDGSLGYSYSSVSSVKNIPKQVYDNKLYKHIGPFCNGHEGIYYGWAGENYMFIDTSNQTLYSVSETESSDEDCGWSMCVVARSGYMIHLFIEEDHKTAHFKSVPVKFNMIDYTSRSWGEGGTTGYSRQFPHFETFPIEDDEDMSVLINHLKKLYWKHEFYFTNSIQNIMDVPKPLRNFFLRKNKKLWWAANKIATHWSRIYWSPYTKIGQKRLIKNMKEMGIEP